MSKLLRTAAVGLGLFHLLVLGWLFGRRLLYPLDLEWMEGGMLCHALRLLEGQPIYAPPSVDFIPFLYTPLYPALLAGLAKVGVGISYAVARGVSVASFAGALWLGYRFAAGLGESRAAAGAAMAIPAAAFALTGAFYDLARPDSLWLFLCVAASVLLYQGARDGLGDRRRFREPGAHLAVVAAALLLVAAFFTKQTASPLMIALGLALIALNPALVPTFALTAAIVGLPSLYLLDRGSGHWFWRYIFELHQGHAFYWRRAFVETPVTLVKIVGPALLLVPWAAVARRSPGVLYATWLAVGGIATAATASGTQWAVSNAYIPGVFFPALAAGVAGGALLVGRRRDVPRLRPALVFALVGASLVLKLPAFDGRRDDAFKDLSKARLYHRFDPRRFVPTAEDREAGQRLLDRMRVTSGEVMIPFHPFYAHLAGKRTYVHQMGVMDVYGAGLGTPAGLAQAIAQQRFALVVLDDKIADKWHTWPGLRERYQRADTFIGPRAVSGAQTVPMEFWVPRVMDLELQ